MASTGLFYHNSSCTTVREFIWESEYSDSFFQYILKKMVNIYRKCLSIHWPYGKTCSWVCRITYSLVDTEAFCVLLNYCCSIATCSVVVSIPTDTKYIWWVRRDKEEKELGRLKTIVCANLEKKKQNSKTVESCSNWPTRPVLPCLDSAKPGWELVLIIMPII